LAIEKKKFAIDYIEKKVKKKKVEIMEKEIVQSSDSNDITFKLINEIKSGNLIVAENIINMHNDILNNRDFRGWTALHWACYFGYDEIVERLLEKDVKINIETLQGDGNGTIYIGKTAMEIAELRHNKKCIKKIKKHIKNKRVKKAIGVGRYVLEVAR